MKKYSIAVIILSIIGAVLSAALFIEHINPEANMGFLSCGTDIVNPCIAVSSSPYSELFGIPVAALGLFMYLVLLVTAIIAEYAGGDYRKKAAAIIGALTALSLVIDIFLFSRLVALGTYCTLCIWTYAVNLLLLAVCIPWLMRVQKESGTGIASILRDLFLSKEDNPHYRASSSAYVLAIIFLFALVAVTSLRVRGRESDGINDRTMQAFLGAFYEVKSENLALPQNGLVFGNPKAKLTIVVFSDYLCSACYQFYKIERYLLSKYRDRIKFVNFIFPLDTECNSELKKTIYPDSCTASRAVLASAKLGIMKRFVVAHFASYGEYEKGYSAGRAIQALRDAGYNTMEDTFVDAMKSGDTDAILKSHIDAAVKNKIDATPTFFIAGRRLVGIPQKSPIKLIEAIVASELAKIK